MCSLLHVLRRKFSAVSSAEFSGRTLGLALVEAGFYLGSRQGAHWVESVLEAKSRILIRNCLGILTPDPAFLPHMLAFAPLERTQEVSAYSAGSTQGAHREHTGSTQGAHREITAYLAGSKEVGYGRIR